MIRKITRETYAKHLYTEITRETCAKHLYKRQTVHSFSFLRMISITFKIVSSFTTLK